MNNCPFYSMFNGTSCAFAEFCFLKMAPKSTVEVLSSVPKCKTTVKFPTENICMLRKLHPGMNYGATGREFKAKASTLHIK